jgi:hypothetical protein
LAIEKDLKDLVIELLKTLMQLPPGMGPPVVDYINIKGEVS